MDLHAPAKNRNKTAGFCDAERDGLAALLREGGLRDVWRDANPAQQQFTYWSSRFNCRANDKGWRLDYVLADAARVKTLAAAVRATWPLGADHVPVVAELELA
jgi:exonuclease III